MTSSNPEINRLLQFMEKVGREVYPERPSVLHSEITSRAIDKLLEVFRIKQRAKILDVGCGQAPALEIFAEKGFIPVGITLDNEDLTVCQSKGFTVAKMDQSFLAFDAGTFDLVWARHVIEHSIFPLFTLAGFHDVLNDNGVLYLEVPAPDTSCHHERNPNHYSVLGKSAWESLIEASGFEIVLATSYQFEVVVGADEYWGFYCRKNAISRQTWEAV